ncbi:MAG: 50S ribosomal protein L4 [Bacteroidota bacterium]|nr:50S ribosomal protein L4 [Bacteroidota bacterium]
MQVNVIGINGEETGRSIDLPEDIFGIEPNEHVLYLAVKEYLANQRQGTHDSKERNEVARSTRKFKRQKGTGGARAGSMKNIMFKGGGRAFGPHPRDYSQKLNKKVKALARKSALSQQLKANKIVIMEDFNLETRKTKDFQSILNKLDLASKKSLFVTAEYNETVYLAGRNLPKTTIQMAGDLNTYEILHAHKLVLTESSIEKIKYILG